MIDIDKLRRLAQAVISKMNALDPEFVSSVTPLAVLELLDRLEAAERELVKLRAKIEQMERQDCSKQSVPAEVPREFVMDAIAQALGDAYDCTRVWSAWGYGTMSQDDFHLIAEDGDRLSEIADAAIMVMGASAPKPCAQPAPSVPDGWLRAIDEALVIAHIGVANAHDTYEQATAKLDNLIGFNVDIATDPAVNGGWKLVPVVSSDEMDSAGSEHCDGYLSKAQVVWDAMLAAAPSQEKDNGSI